MWQVLAASLWLDTHWGMLILPSSEVDNNVKGTFCERRRHLVGPGPDLQLLSDGVRQRVRVRRPVHLQCEHLRRERHRGVPGQDGEAEGGIANDLILRKPKDGKVVALRY